VLYDGQKQKKIRKKQPWIGRQHMVKRPGLADVEVFLYEPEEQRSESLPVMFNVHGGAWVGGDATLLDTQSQQLADMLHAFVVNINYKKLDQHPFPYPQAEVKDVVLYFSEHAAEYGLDQKRFNLIGYSAGGHICAGAAMLLRDAHFPLCCQILCYPFLDFHIFDGGSALGMDAKTIRLMEEIFYRGGVHKDDSLMSPGAAPQAVLTGLAPAELLLCGPDALYQQGIDYQKHLQDAGVEAQLKVFEESTHGFLESNYPEGRDALDEKQKAMREECFAYLAGRMPQIWRHHDEKRK